MKKILLCKESDTRETRTALIPADIKKLIQMGYEITAVRGTGERSGFSDSDYEAAGAKLVSTNEEGYKGSEIILRIMKPENFIGASPEQVGEFIENCVRPVLEANGITEGEDIEINV